jgi:hypothetical protein
MQALKGWPPPEEESPKGIRRLIRQWLLIPVEWKRPARQRRGLFACPGGLAGVVAGTIGGIVAALSGLERGGWGGERLKVRGLGRRISARGAPRGEAEGVVCPSGVVGGVGSRGRGGRRLASGRMGEHCRAFSRG